MNRPALVLAAHGAGETPAANADIERLAKRVAARLPQYTVVCAYHKGDPHFSCVLDRIDAKVVTVVPLMTSAGYYCDTVLPRELAKNRRFASIKVSITPPVGLSEKIAEIVEVRADRICRDFDLAKPQTSLVIVGHGTKRHPQSRASTERLVEQLRAAQSWHEVVAAFLDDEPRVEDVEKEVTGANVIVIPFLIGGGTHDKLDIPRAFVLDEEVVVTSAPNGNAVLNRFAYHDEAIGRSRRIVDIVIELAQQTRERVREAEEGSRRSSVVRKIAATGWKPVAHDTGNKPVPHNSTGYKPVSHHLRRLRLGTRASAMALWQARLVAVRLGELGVMVEIVEMTTSGDRELSVPIADLPSDAPFTDDIDDALRRGEIDLAVHALKDLPTFPDPTLMIAAVLERQDASEALVSHSGLKLHELPAGARVGTSSPRRAAQLIRLRPYLQPVSIRGAVDARVRDVRAGKFDAAILATAGLERLGLLHEIAERFAIDKFMPAPGQGALAVQVRADDEDTAAMVAALNDDAASHATRTELAVLRRFEGNAEVVVAAYATIRRSDDAGLYRGAFAEAERGRSFPGRIHQSGSEDPAERVAASGLENIVRSATHGLCRGQAPVAPDGANGPRRLDAAAIQRRRKLPGSVAEVHTVHDEAGARRDRGLVDGRIELHARLLSLDGTRSRDVCVVGDDPEALADEAAERLSVAWAEAKDVVLESQA